MLRYQSCSGWGLQGLQVAKQPVSSYLAFPPLPAKAGGISLLHSPWSRLHRMLSGILSCGARTFLVFSPRSSGLLKTNKLFDIYNTAAVFTLAITVFHRIGNRKGRHFHMTSAAAAVLDWRGRHNFIFL